jgi:hypothetical protein
VIQSPYEAAKKAANPAGISEKVIRLLEIYTLIARTSSPR